MYKLSIYREIIMGKKATDLRVRRTCSLLSLALVNLMQTRSFDKISVLHICERAMVHRATFYLHFDDKYDLLRYILSEYAKQITDDSIADLKEYITDAAAKFFADIEKNYLVYKRMIEKNDSLVLLNVLEDSIHNIIYKKMSECLDEPEEKLRTRASFYCGGVMNLAVKMCTGGLSRSCGDVLPEIRKLIDKVL